MEDDISEYIEDFPLAPRDSIDPTTIDGDLSAKLEELLKIAGYPETKIFGNVVLEVDDDVYDPTDVEIGPSINYSIYVSEDRDSQPFLVGSGEPIMSEIPITGAGDYGTYESMRVCHENADPELTLFLSPFGLLIYDGVGDMFGSAGPRPIEYYPFHESDFEIELADKLLEELEPPDYLL